MIQSINSTSSNVFNQEYKKLNSVNKNEFTQACHKLDVTKN